MTDSLFFLGWTQVWQISLLVGVVAVINRIWFRDKPEWAYSLWLLVIAKSLVPPLWSSRLGVFSWCQLEVSNAEILESSSFASISQDWITHTLGSSGLVAIVAIWFIGTITCLTLTLLRWRSVHAALTKFRVPTTANVEEALASIKDDLAIDPVPVYVTSMPIGPAALGLWKRKLVLPESIVASKSAAELEPILTHELMHIRRGDTFVSLLRAVAQSLMWFNPLIWWATRQASYQCERCVDADVMGLKRYTPGQYAEALISVLESKCQLEPILGSAGMNGFQITESRLRFIMASTGKPRNPYPIFRLSCMVGLALVLLPGGRLVVHAESMVPVSRFNLDHICDGMHISKDVIEAVKNQQ